MFSVDFLNKIREAELAQIVALLDPGSRILEIGGGTGIQAAALEKLGYRVVSVDVADSPYRDSRAFPIIDYDGRTLPFPNNSFDIIVSSNVLEHIGDLDAAFAEFSRVLTPQGSQIHIMPTGAWRFWTTISGYIELLSQASALTLRTLSRMCNRHFIRVILDFFKQLLRLCIIYGYPRRHGEHGNALTELHTFSRFAWERRFRTSGLVVDSAQPGGLFYTGHMCLGEHLSLPKRRVLARFLGSACVLYKVEVGRTEQ